LFVLGLPWLPIAADQLSERSSLSLADHCNQAVNPAIFEVLEQRGFLDHPAQIIVSKEETMEEIRNSQAMRPTWSLKYSMRIEHRLP
jgi:hypothetical protein